MSFAERNQSFCAELSLSALCAMSVALDMAEIEHEGATAISMKRFDSRPGPNGGPILEEVPIASIVSSCPSIKDLLSIFACFRSIRRSATYFIPKKDRRRHIEDADNKIIVDRWKTVGKGPEAGTGIEPTELATIFNDCVSHIKAHQQQHWRIFTWCIAGLAAIAGFALSTDTIYESPLMMLLSTYVIWIVGAYGTYFMNEESVQLERNRNHLDAIRACMHQTVVDIYVDRPDGNSPDKASTRRTDMKRERDLVMHKLVAAWAVLLSVLLFISFLMREV